MRQFHKGVWDGKSIFVFGSNLAGRHGAGAAKYAVKHCGAIYGVGEGLQGKSYAVPTKDKNINTLPLAIINEFVELFIDFAEGYPNTKFFVTRIGCGLAGYKDDDIAPMFRDAPENCVLSEEWREYTE